MPIKLVNPQTNVEQDFYTPEELESTVTQRSNSVREEEKKKLYPDIERYKNRATAVENELATAKRELETMNQKLQNNPGNQPTAADKAEADRLKAEVATLTTRLQQTEDKVQAAVDKAIEQVNALNQEQRRKDQLAAKRDTLISAAQGKIIPDLVFGNTPEELEASAVKARERYQEIYEAGKKETEAALKGALPGPVNPGGNANTNGTQGNAIVDPGALKALTDKEWQEQKAAIKQKAFAEVGLPMRVRN